MAATGDEHPSHDTRSLRELAADQHGVLSRAQLRRYCSDQSIKTRVATGQLHRIHHSVYAVGHTNAGVARDVAAALSCV